MSDQGIVDTFIGQSQKTPTDKVFSKTRGVTLLCNLVEKKQKVLHFQCKAPVSSPPVLSGPSAHAIGRPCSPEWPRAHDLVLLRPELARSSADSHGRPSASGLGLSRCAGSSSRSHDQTSEDGGTGERTGVGDRRGEDEKSETFHLLLGASLTSYSQDGQQVGVAV